MLPVPRLHIRGAVAALLLSAGVPLAGQELEFRGQASALVHASNDPGLSIGARFRYLPGLFFAAALTDVASLDAECALDLSASARARRHERRRLESSFDPYRLWLRYAGPQSEVRAGLQKISFGSAALFRPLMWFDAMDPRDPLQITRGVYALLGRYYVASTTNLWLWAVLGDDETKGWESVPSRRGSLEYGGRLQLPLFAGEAALTYHHRTAELNASVLSPAGLVRQTLTIPEDRLGIDGKWDVGPGVWLEATLTRQHSGAIPFSWHRALTIGADYTLPFGNGLSVLGEYFCTASTKQALGDGQRAAFAGFSFLYPVTILDDASAIMYYDAERADWFTFLSWRRTYDDWVVQFMVFANPEAGGALLPSQQELGLAGRGILLLIAFNH